jgi:short-subunit dehydrogenase
VTRSEVKLRALADGLSRQYGVRVDVIAADLADPKAGQRLQDEVGARSLEVDLLVNNAGFGGFSEFSGRTPTRSTR